MLIRFVLAVLASPFKSKVRLEACECRSDTSGLRRRVEGLARPTNNDRWFFAQFHRYFL